MITSISQLDFNKQYTYADYVLWQFKERVELLKGYILPMAAPNVKHQHISSQLHGFLWSHLRKKPCSLFAAPFDVRLPIPKNKIKGNKVDTVVQPDLCVVCNEDKLDKQGCIGAPDLVIEILSPGNSKKEMKYKYELYQEAGVLEYWVIDPEHNSALVFHLNAKTNLFVAAPPLTDEDVLKSKIFENLEIELKEVFPSS